MRYILLREKLSIYFVFDNILSLVRDKSLWKSGILDIMECSSNSEKNITKTFVING